MLGLKVHATTAQFTPFDCKLLPETCQRLYRQGFTLAGLAMNLPSRVLGLKAWATIKLKNPLSPLLGHIKDTFEVPAESRPARSRRLTGKMMFYTVRS